jgi:hypothetical protein
MRLGPRLMGEARQEPMPALRTASEMRAAARLRGLSRRLRRLLISEVDISKDHIMITRLLKKSILTNSRFRYGRMG